MKSPTLTADLDILDNGRTDHGPQTLMMHGAIGLLPSESSLQTVPLKKAGIDYCICIINIM